jgi:hypothetical protein
VVSGTSLLSLHRADHAIECAHMKIAWVPRVHYQALIDCEGVRASGLAGHKCEVK